jgi:hypothetical protein
MRLTSLPRETDAAARARHAASRHDEHGGNLRATAENAARAMVQRRR